MGSDNLHWMKKRQKAKRESKKIREYKDSILIVCEGEKTEPNYFESFPNSNVKVKVIGTGRNTHSLLEAAIEKWKEYAEMGNFYEKLWCVFDKDDFPMENFHKAFESIENQRKKLNRRYKRKVKREIKININIAYSNEAFELWYLLHYDFFDNAMSRSDYKQLLTKRMGIKYKKNDPQIYFKLKKLTFDTEGERGQSFAIRNAKKQREKLSGPGCHYPNPSTTVDLLVEELNKHLKQ